MRSVDGVWEGLVIHDVSCLFSTDHYYLRALSTLFRSMFWYKNIIFPVLIK